jgi:D-3-phosphoglycerate dehydrogenase
MTTFKAVRTDRELECPDIDGGLRALGCELVLLGEGVSEDALIAAVSDADLLLMCYTPVTARVIAGAARLKGIVKYGVGIDAIDIPAAMARGIAVVNVPEYAEETVAEGAFALMIALMKKIVPISREMAARGWAWPTPQWLGLDLASRTLGLVGVGRIGRSMARMAAGFRMRVIGYDPHTPADELARAGVERVTDLGELLAASDVVSIHATLNDETRHLIGARELARMKRSAFLINAARGAIVDEAALARALENGPIAGAGLDVYENEPAITPALLDDDRVVLMPHAGSATVETRREMARMVAEDVRRVLSGEKPLRPVSPEGRR